MEFKVDGGEYLGRIIVELYRDHVPVTVQNFIEILIGHLGMCYKGCPVHRIVKDRYLQTGDVTKGNGTGGFSIYGESFDEENHNLKHTKAGEFLLIINRKEPRYNLSSFYIVQFFITRFRNSQLRMIPNYVRKEELIRILTG